MRPCALGEAAFNGRRPRGRRSTAMPIYYPDILDQRTAARTFTYGDKDVMLYALGIGLGADPMDEKELAFVYEKDLKVAPSAATVLSAGGRGSQASGPAPTYPAGYRE